MSILEQVNIYDHNPQERKPTMPNSPLPSEQELKKALQYARELNVDAYNKEEWVALKTLIDFVESYAKPKGLVNARRPKPAGDWEKSFDVIICSAQILNPLGPTVTRIKDFIRNLLTANGGENK